MEQYWKLLCMSLQLSAAELQSWMGDNTLEFAINGLCDGLLVVFFVLVKTMQIKLQIALLNNTTINE